MENPSVFADIFGLTDQQMDDILNRQSEFSNASEYDEQPDLVEITVRFKTEDQRRKAADKILSTGMLKLRIDREQLGW